jgi:hypothetical protein
LEFCGETVALAVSTWLPFISVLRVGVKVVMVPEELNWKVPVICGALAGEITVAVSVRVEPKLTVVALAFSAAVVGYRAEIFDGGEVEPA